MLSKPCGRFCYVFRSLGGGRLRSFLVIFRFFENQIPIMSPSGLETFAEATPKNYESTGLRRRSACPTSSRASAPPSVIIPRTVALDARVEPVHDETESAALIFGRSQFLPRALWGAGSGRAVSILYARQLPRGADVRPLRP